MTTSTTTMEFVDALTPEIKHLLQRRASYHKHSVEDEVRIIVSSTLMPNNRAKNSFADRLLAIGERVRMTNEEAALIESARLCQKDFHESIT